MEHFVGIDVTKDRLDVPCRTDSRFETNSFTCSQAGKATEGRGGLQALGAHR
jgi:hypothetical protein